MDRAAETGDLRGLVGLTEPIVRFWFDLGLSGEVHPRLHDAAVAPGAPDDERVRGLTTAALLAIRGNPGNAHRSASEAVDAARAAGAGGALALGLSVRAQAGAVSGRSTSEQVDADVEEAVEHAAQCGDAATHAYVLAIAGWTLLRSRTIDAGCRLLEQAIEVCGAAGVAFHLPAAHGVLGLWPVFSGRLDRTRRHARRAWELARLVGRPGWEAVGLAGLGAADVLQGNHEQAQDWLSRTQEVLARPGFEGTEYDMFVRPWLALAAYASRDLQTAHTTAAEIVRLGRRRGAAGTRPSGSGCWACSPTATGAPPKREPTSRPAAPCRPTRGSRSRWAGRRWVSQSWPGRARTPTRRGRWPTTAWSSWTATATGSAPRRRWRRSPAWRVALGEPERSLRLLAASQRFHADRGIARFPVQADRFERAVGAARVALDPTDASACWDAGRDLSLADAIAYARRGRGPRRRPPLGWASLTPAERDVVRLVAEGHTNAEIGQRLFISVNTVKKHLSHVYTKVDVDARADLAAQVARRDL